MASIGCNLRITGFCSRGQRKYMEDFFSVAYQQSQDGDDLEFAFIGIFDGHGGEHAAKFAKQNLMGHIVSNKLFWSTNDEDVLKAIKKGYLSTHHAMWKDLKNWPKTSSGLPSTAGTTSSIAFIRQGKIYVGHCGDSGIVLGFEQETPDGKKLWKARPLTEDHKPESNVEKKRIMESGGKVIVKSGVPRVVWNRPRIGHKGSVRRSTQIDEIPFLAVARSLGDLWSYNAAKDEFVVSPEPDVAVIDIDPTTFKCLVFGTDGLWNVITAASAIEIVRSAEMMNEMNVNNGLASDWKNPSRFLVETALDRWAITKMRADNTSVVTIMLDPPNKKNALKICKSPPTTMEAASYLSQSRTNFEDKNVMYDYSTREAYNLEAVNVNASNYVSYEHTETSPDPHYYYEHYGQQETTPSNNSYMTSIADSFNTIFSPTPSTSRTTNHHHYHTENHQDHVNTTNYSLTKLQTKHERMEADNNLAFNYTNGNAMLPSLLNHDYPHSNKYHMERYDYLQYQESLESCVVHPIDRFLDPLDVPPQENTAVPVNLVINTNNADDSIQINEITSSFTEKTVEVEETKEEVGKTAGKKQRTAASAIKKRIFYETRLTNRKPRACSKSISKKVTIKKKQSKKKIKITPLTTKIPEVRISSSENDKRKPRNIVKNKENNGQNSKQTIAPTRTLRNTKHSAIAVKPDMQILKQSQPVQRSITLRSTNVQGTLDTNAHISSKRKRSLVNVGQDSPRNAKLRKIK